MRMLRLILQVIFEIKLTHFGARQTLDQFGHIINNRLTSLFLSHFHGYGLAIKQNYLTVFAINK